MPRQTAFFAVLVRVALKLPARFTPASCGHYVFFFF